MGRQKKYKTEDERRTAQLKWSKEYYEKNKEVIRKRNRDRYHKRKGDVGD